ncbi:baseplate J/gp47 family protein [Undibacterium flavidum]|uniref:Baseplate J/gp47 family protein n=1 Tax=Undibacterium flavidum TaxID=2762297 RepID=A0ABR6YFI1_9BURK|nr:baseplate J/gp47 family protein [Undibacterium flavidum]MBC3875292.1 baseplate J/gp47 family protein [Undibacterium flavidum]
MNSRLLIRDGRSQEQRHLSALSGDYFALNDMRFETLLSLATEYARLVRFYQLDLRADGDWHQFFGADETVLMATILAVDTAQLTKQFENRLVIEPQFQFWITDDIQKKVDGAYHNIVDSPLLLVKLLDFFLISASRQSGAVAQEVAQLLEDILRGLKWELQTLCDALPKNMFAHMSSTEANQFLTRFSHQFSGHLRGLSELRVSGARLRSLSESEIRDNFQTLLHAVRMLQEGVQRLLPQSMTNGEHDPANSLLIAFIQLFQKLQIRLNRFANKHIDFYYQQVLRMHKRDTHPDSTFLVIRPSPKTQRIVIDKGCEFIAGVDAQHRDIVYTADETSVLNDAEVVEIHSLFFDRSVDDSYGSYTRASYQRQCQTLAPNCDNSEHAKLPPVPLLGAPRPGDSLTGGSAAHFGFALQSKVLFMREGQRTVKVTFQYRNHEENTIVANVLAVASKLQANTHVDLSHVTDSLENDVFIKLMRGMFTLSLTTSEGWYQITEYKPGYANLERDILIENQPDKLANKNDDYLSIEFTLPESAPAVVGYHTALHGAGQETSFPVLRFEMTRNEYYYPYDILARLILQEIKIEVSVRGCRQLLVHNQIGQLNASAAFMPFGALPSKGSYLIVGYQEVLYKHLQDLELELEWAGLPNGLGDFPEYYASYPEPLKSGEVIAGAAVLVDGKWAKTETGLHLFGYTRHLDGSLSNRTSTEQVINLKSVVPHFKAESYFRKGVREAGFSYSSSSMNGLFKMTLEAPSSAFGHEEYPHLLASTLTQNARQKKMQSLKPLPNRPYTPQIERIVLNYRAQSLINFEKNATGTEPLEEDKFIHIHPCGWETMRASENRLITQIPWIESAGNLMIGLRSQKLQSVISLYFYLREDSLPVKNITGTGLRWWYLASNRWVRIPDTHVLQDSTCGFMSSGIVQLQVPDEIDTLNTIMPADVYWIRVTADQEIDRFCSVYSIYAQAIRVTWSKEQGQKNSPVLPAMSLTKSKKSIAGIAKILQMRNSIDGKAIESSERFRTRVSERLRHKNRALTAADYEQMILEKFPQVFKVKCFANLRLDPDPTKQIRAGHILIIPIPYLNRGGHFNQKPTLSGYLIQEIRRFVERYAPAGASVKVENPVYEEIQVRCSIKLNSTVAAGRQSERINQAICDYLSPWNPNGQNQHFGWYLQQHEIVSFLLDLDFVEDVTAVSMLQIASKTNGQHLHFHLRDNANFSCDEKNISPTFPWSIAVPMNQHWIVLKDDSKIEPAKPIGINELKIGSTFIISKRVK